jgi:hypothetical protein
VAVVEGPEHLLARSLPRSRRASAAWAERTAAGYLRELALARQWTGRRVVLNVNGAQSPPWADAVADGPLFASLRKPSESAPLGPLCDALLGLSLQPGVAPAGLRIDWHLGERDFAPAARERLLRVARAALAGAPLVFAFDRPRRPLSLGEGVDRRHPAVLLGRGAEPSSAGRPGPGGRGA